MESTTQQLSAPAPLQMSNIATDWMRFKGQWNEFVKIADIDQEDEDRQAAILLVCIGYGAWDIYTSLQFHCEADKKKPKKLIEAFDRYCTSAGSVDVVQSVNTSCSSIESTRHLLDEVAAKPYTIQIDR
jgi:hypothetical protein